MCCTAGYSLLRTGGFSCSLDVLHWGLGINILQFLTEILQLLFIQSLDRPNPELDLYPDHHCPKMMDPSPMRIHNIVLYYNGFLTICCFRVSVEPGARLGTMTLKQISAPMSRIRARKSSDFAVSEVGEHCFRISNNSINVAIFIRFRNDSYVSTLNVSEWPKVLDPTSLKNPLLLAPESLEIQIL